MGGLHKEGVVFGAWLSQGKTYLRTGQPGRVFFFIFFCDNFEVHLNIILELTVYHSSFFMTFVLI